MRPKLWLATLLAALVFAPAAEAHTLSYGKAKRAAQHRADSFADDSTRITRLSRESRHVYTAYATWTNIIVGGCEACGYSDTRGIFDTNSREWCSVNIRVRLRGRRVRTAVTDSACL